MARTKQTAKRVETAKAPKKTLAVKAPAKTAPAEKPVVRKPHRFHPGTVARREIVKLQKSTKLLFTKAGSARLIREIAQEYKSDLRFQETALLIIQEAAEVFLTDCHAKGHAIDIYAERETLSAGAFRLAMALDPARVHMVPAKPAVAPITRTEIAREEVVQHMRRGHGMGNQDATPVERVKRAKTTKSAAKPKKQKKEKKSKTQAADVAAVAADAVPEEVPVEDAIAAAAVETPSVGVEEEVVVADAEMPAVEEEEIAPAAAPALHDAQPMEVSASA